ncbi:hypothetical protein OHT59_24440 [Streptomyces sp. NBC_00243]|uniref:hypothetical protein n=1 Tax=Streptomyces sp. NBC_00243 TaxID=2975688 RepID=UPI002DD8A984|nr:hypothetical protein [Streptomyces sp. NBC_00243]WRZ21423.1 hypothetical protein OHT59_24440 [Streptomyces sp. NBC_00243]
MLRITAIAIKSVTAIGTVGFAAQFADGLTVIRARNTSGKTLLLNSIMYALGLEGTLQPGKQGVLTTGLTKSVNVNGMEHQVQNSWIDLEIANGSAVITIRRYALPPEGIKPDLITVWDQAMISTSVEDARQPKHYYVGRGGTAQNEAGFHHFLAKFLGWDLPQVPTYNGKEVPLYLQVLAALFFVEQKQGWSGIVPKIPTQYQIREPLRRSIEFYLKLDVLERARRRAELQQGLAVIRAEYANLRGALDASAHLSNARVMSTSEFGTSSFYRTPLFGATSDTVDVGEAITLYYDDQWESLNVGMQRLQLSIRSLGIAERIPILGPEAATLGSELHEARERLREITTELQALDDSANMLDMQRGTLAKRHRLLEQEQRRYKDIRSLESLGAEFSRHAIAHHDCPTCQQSLEGTELSSGAPVLSTSESAALVDQQIHTITTIINDAERSARTNEAIRGTLEREAGEIRARIRAIQADLEGHVPRASIAQIQRRIVEEARLQELVRLRDNAQATCNDLIDAQRRAVIIKTELDSFGDEEFSAGDLHKFDVWQRDLRTLLSAFRFGVFSPAEIAIDPQTMRPTHAQGDLGFQGSASDGLKMRWAYMLSLVQSSSATGGCHPGLLLLDGPRMYDVEASAMKPFLQQCAALPIKGRKAQIILTLSEDPVVIAEWLSGYEYKIINIEDRLLS